MYVWVCEEFIFALAVISFKGGLCFARVLEWLVEIVSGRRRGEFDDVRYCGGVEV